MCGVAAADATSTAAALPPPLPSPRRSCQQLYTILIIYDYIQSQLHTIVCAMLRMLTKSYTNKIFTHNYMCCNHIYIQFYIHKQLYLHTIIRGKLRMLTLTHKQKKCMQPYVAEPAHNCIELYCDYNIQSFSHKVICACSQLHAIISIYMICEGCSLAHVITQCHTLYCVG